ncbi:methyltransferase [Micromonospora auratinigra]|uniref:O-methyltransferase n=1 Tax=Micromonospora auratinigra TaxID=261654 RepID=A0A1A8ZG12_9ACTN|nr:methyltransferase [Micromonospora auratinigra]SBT42807.1 O-methyltransferase [Micromonospora auratinigra]
MTSTNSLPDAVMRLRGLALSAGYAAAVRAAARLRLPDAFDEQTDIPTLAGAVDADRDALTRLMRSLVVHGVFAEPEPGTFAHTELSRLLREDHPRSLRHMILWATEPWTWQVWGHLDTAVRTGRGVNEEVWGDEFFSWLHKNAPESADVFNRAMTQSSQLSADVVARVLDVSGARTVADIAGGQGLVLATLLESNPELSGVLLDLPNVVAAADPRLREGGALADRARLVPGDCRAEIPVEADVYILKNILEWDDDSTVTTLRNVVKAARPGSRVVVIENLVDGSPEMRFTTAMDLLLLLNVGGRKHTRDGLVELVKQAGLEVRDVRPVGPYLHMVESVVPQG